MGVFLPSTSEQWRCGQKTAWGHFRSWPGAASARARVFGMQQKTHYRAQVQGLASRTFLSETTRKEAKMENKRLNMSRETAGSTEQGTLMFHSSI